MIKIIEGMRFDVDAVSAAFYDMIVEQGDEGVVAFGMLPARFMEMVEVATRKKIIAEKAKFVGCAPEDIEDYIDAEELNHITRAILHEIHVGIFRRAAQLGAMIV